MSAKVKNSPAMDLEICVWELEALLKLIGEAYQEIIEKEHNEGNAAAGLQQMRWGVVERLRASAYAVINEVNAPKRAKAMKGELHMSN